MRFSERYGGVPARPIQIGELDQGTRTRLWNVFFENFVGVSSTSSNYKLHVCRRVWSDVLHLGLESYHHSYVKQYVAKAFRERTWSQVMDAIELAAELENGDSFGRGCNRVFEEEKCGYRFIGKTLCPIADELELEELGDAIKATASDAWKTAHVHLRTAIARLSDREAPDYRNSVKESLSAVEAVAARIAGAEKATLGEALSVLEKEGTIHPALKKGYNALYGYANDASGIRHALKGEDESSFEYAKYMLVSCAAFVNYLLVKADEGGLEVL